jgi:hypothetical protein
MFLPSGSLGEAICNHIGCGNPFNFEICIGIAILCILFPGYNIHVITDNSCM